MTTRSHHLSIDTQPFSGDSRPPLLVKVTGYRLLNVTVLCAFGISRVVLMYQGQTAVPTTLEWVMGVVIATGYRLSSAVSRDLR